MRRQQHSHGLVGRCPPEDKCAGREGERHDPARPKVTNLQATREIPSKVGGRATVCVVEPAYHAVPSNMLHTLLHGAWLGSGSTYGHRLRQSTGTSLHRGRQPSRTRGCSRPTRRSARCGVAAMRQVSASSATLPQAQRGVPASSTSETWCSDEFKVARTGTSYRHLGRGRSSSMKCSDQGHTRSSTRTGGSSPTHGTLSTCAH
jgi:hypothetical protein